MDLKSFVAEVDAVTQAIYESYRATPLTETPLQPRDFAEVLSFVRAVAEDLILLDDVDKAISQLRQDQERLAIVVLLTTDMISPEDHRVAVRLAHAATSHMPTILPFYAYASYLIELCNGLELVSKPPS